MMSAQHITIGMALLVVTGCQSMTGSSLPTMTRTGQVTDVVILEDAPPATVTVNPGDEIRWVNKRQGVAQVVFMDPVMDRLSCERNFDSSMKQPDRQRYTANLNTNDSASVCFSRSGQVKYVIRATSQNVPSGETSEVPGLIQVAGAETHGSAPR